MHLTFDQWIKLGEGIGGLGSFGLFLFTVYKKLIKPPFQKLISIIDEEKKFRADIRQTILTVNEFKLFFASIKTEIVDLVDLIKWATDMRRYAEVTAVPKGTSVRAKAAVATGGIVEIKENGGLKIE